MGEVRLVLHKVPCTPMLRKAAVAAAVAAYQVSSAGVTMLIDSRATVRVIKTESLLSRFQVLPSHKQTWTPKKPSRESFLVRVFANPGRSLSRRVPPPTASMTYAS